MVRGGRPLGVRRRDGIKRTAPLVVVALRHLAPQSEELAALSSLLGIVVMIGYYAGFEAAFGKTPGKMLVGTRVVTTTGGEPSFGQCLGRTFARCVPFEPFSFFGANAVGWHDRWTNTRVIRTR